MEQKNTFTKFKIEELFKNLTLIGQKDLPGAKFNYALIKNLNLLRPVVEAMDKVKTDSKPYMEYQTKRVELAKKYSKKNEDGSPVMENNSFTIENIKEFTEEHAKLAEEYKDQLKEIDDLYKQEELVLGFPHTIKLELVPESIKTTELNSIYDIIEGE